MRSPLVTRGTAIVAAAVMLFGSSLIFWSCTKEGPAGPAGPPGGSGWNGNLQDPSIIPEVISTSPADHSIGPFKLFSPGDDQYNPNFVLQFNKLINTNELKTTSVRVTGFDKPVIALLFQYYYPIRIFNRVTNGPFDNVLAFSIYDSGRYYSPRSLYAIGGSYTVTVDTSVTDINGNHMAHPFSFVFTPEPNFRVTTMNPDDGATGVFAGSSISVTFNSHVDTSIQSYLHVTPSPEGKWRVSEYDSSTVYFLYQGPLPYDSSFTVSVDPLAHDIHGNRTSVPYSATFRTAAFGVSDTYPNQGDGTVPPATSVTLYLNGSADTSSIRAAFSISPSTAGTLSVWSSNFSFVPTLGLAPASAYTITMSTALKASDGTALKSPFTLSFTTSQFGISDNYPNDGDFNVYPGQQIGINFNSFIDSTSALSSFSIYPPVNGTLTSSSGRPFGGGWMTFNHSSFFASNTTYTVTISTAVMDLRGNHLPSPFTFSFKTGTN